MKSILLLTCLTTLVAFSSSWTKAEQSSASGDDGTAEAKAPVNVKPYPLETCIVSGKQLGAMGEPVVLDYEGQEMKFCCDRCLVKFDADPQKFIAQLKTSKERSERTSSTLIA